MSQRELCCILTRGPKHRDRIRRQKKRIIQISEEGFPVTLGNGKKVVSRKRKLNND